MAARLIFAIMEDRRKQSSAAMDSRPLDFRDHGRSQKCGAAWSGMIAWGILPDTGRPTFVPDTA
jgi:hypothetical protein